MFNHIIRNIQTQIFTHLVLAVFAALLFLPVSVSAQAAPAKGQVVIGVVLAVRGRVEIRRNDGAVRAALIMGEVLTGDIIATLGSARIQISLTDGSLIILEENTTLELFEYRYRVAGQPDAKQTKLNSGTIHVTTGTIANRNPENVYTLTPVARVALDPEAHRFSDEITDDSLPERMTFYSITATYDSTTTLFITGAAIIIYSNHGEENMTLPGRSFTVTGTGVFPEGGLPGLPVISGPENIQPPGIQHIDPAELPKSKTFLSGYAVGILDAIFPPTMRTMLNTDPLDFTLDDVVEQKNTPTVVNDGSMSLILGPGTVGAGGGAAPPAPVLDFNLGGNNSVSVIDSPPQITFNAGQISVSGSTDYLGWGTWQSVFVNPADPLDLKTYNGVWSASGYSQPTPAAYINSLNTVGVYNGAALCVVNAVNTLHGRSNYEVNFGNSTFTGNMAFPSLNMISSGTLTGNGLNGQINAINGNAAGIQSNLFGGLSGPEAQVLNGVFQAVQGANTYDGVFNGQ